jgi:hypothetical protein
MEKKEEMKTETNDNSQMQIEPQPQTLQSACRPVEVSQAFTKQEFAEKRVMSFPLQHGETLIVSSDEDEKPQAISDKGPGDGGSQSIPLILTKPGTRRGEDIINMDGRYLYDYLYNPPLKKPSTGKLPIVPEVPLESDRLCPGLLKEEKDLKREFGSGDPFIIEILDDSFEYQKKESFGTKMEGKIEKKEEDGEVGTPKSEEIDFEFLGVKRKVPIFDEDLIKGTILEGIEDYDKVNVNKYGEVHEVKEFKPFNPMAKAMPIMEKKKETFSCVTGAKPTQLNTSITKELDRLLKVYQNQKDNGRM